MSPALDAPLVLAIAVILTLVTALSLSRLVMNAKLLPDKPNARSSHEQVTSRAGGVGIFAAWLAGALVLAVAAGGPVLAVFIVKLSSLALLAFLVGLADDKWALSPLWKFSGQLACASLFAWSFAPLANAPLPFLGESALGPYGVAVTVLWIVGFMNFFNFMDGLNGIAAGTASTGLVAFAVIAGFSGAVAPAAAALLLAVACFGFLPANLAKGRLFMGDSGSQAISFIIAALGIYAANVSDGAVSALVMPTIFLPFLFDTIWTLADRMRRGQALLVGHREHNYQLLNRLGYSHAKVAALYVALTALASTAAILMLTLAPGDQWIAPAVLTALFLIAAVLIHRQAARAGLFANKEKAFTPRQDARETDVAASSASAAE